MNKIKTILIIITCFVCLVLSGCKPKHEHNYIDGVCECGDTIVVKYQVVFKDFNGNIIKTEEVIKNNSATAPEAPKVEGYVFVGWSIDFSSVTSDLVVTAVYDFEMEYTIKFNLNGGTLEYTELTYTNYQDVELPIPTREHYVFLGWYLKNQPVEKIEKNGNYNLKAEWEGESYEIDYQLNGGELPSNAPEAHYYGSTTTLPIPTQTDYSFEGWYLSSDFSGEPITKLTEANTSDVKIYAKWRKLNPIVTYNLNEGNWQYSTRDEVVEDFLKDAMAWGGKTSKPDGMVRGEGTTQTGFANVFSAIYGFFQDEKYGPKWAWLKQYLIDVSPISTASSLRNGDEAFWRYSLGAFLFEEHRVQYPISADFTVDANANNFWSTLSKYSEKTIELEDSGKLLTPQRIYYIFDGWYLNPEFTGEKVVTADASCTVYAKWIEEIAVTNKKAPNE